MYSYSKNIGPIHFYGKNLLQCILIVKIIGQWISKVKNNLQFILTVKTMDKCNSLTKIIGQYISMTKSLVNAFKTLVHLMHINISNHLNKWTNCNLFKVDLLIHVGIFFKRNLFNWSRKLFGPFIQFVCVFSWALIFLGYNINMNINVAERSCTCGLNKKRLSQEATDYWVSNVKKKAMPRIPTSRSFPKEKG